MTADWQARFALESQDNSSAGALLFAAPGVVITSWEGDDVADRICEAPGCTKLVRRKGSGWADRYCSMHRARLSRHGNLEGKNPQGSPIERVMRKVQVTASGCWEPTLVPLPTGYSSVHTGGHSGVNVPAHRVTYAHFVGPIPPGNHIHHKCENRRCVNPAHLIAVTPKQHRAEHGLGFGPCPTCGADEWFYRANGRGRECKPCNRRISREAKARKRRSA